MTLTSRGQDTEVAVRSFVNNNKTKYCTQKMSSSDTETSSVAEVFSSPAGGSHWDPCFCKDWEKERPTQQCILRIKRDIMSIYKEPPPGMFVVPDSEDVTKIHALITGPFDTPYEGGFFHFLIRFPPDYPIRPPRVKLMTTDGEQVRFNPNLYKNGKVCLSILGTWTGPAWSPAQSLSSVLISIQSLMNEKPYHNEPGFEQERNVGDAQRYNECIRHETIRVAVCGMTEGRCCHLPDQLRGVMEKSFPEFYDYYTSTCRDRLHLDGSNMQDPFGEKRSMFQYSQLLERLEVIRRRIGEGSEDITSDLDSDNSDLDSQEVSEAQENLSPGTSSSG